MYSDILIVPITEYYKVKRSTDDRVLNAWYYDTNNERGVVTGMSNSDNGFVIIGVCSIYVWNVVAKFVKLKFFFFFVDTLVVVVVVSRM